MEVNSKAYQQSESSNGNEHQKLESSKGKESESSKGKEPESSKGKESESSKRWCYHVIEGGHGSCITEVLFGTKENVISRILDNAYFYTDDPKNNAKLASEFLGKLFGCGLLKTKAEGRIKFGIFIKENIYLNDGLDYDFKLHDDHHIISQHSDYILKAIAKYGMN